MNFKTLRLTLADGTVYEQTFTRGFSRAKSRLMNALPYATDFYGCKWEWI